MISAFRVESNTVESPLDIPHFVMATSCLKYFEVQSLNPLVMAIIPKW